MEKLFFTFESSICTEVANRIEFGGRMFKPDRAKAFFDAKICHSLPQGNLNGRGFSAATLANSYKSAELQLCDFDHRLGFYEKDEDGEDRVCGTIAAIEFPPKEEAIALAAEGKGVALRALLVAFRKAKGVEQMLSDIESEKYNWRTSVEVEYPIEKAALYDTVTGEFFAWSDCSDEMKKLVTPSAVGKYKGHEMLFCPGGEDGVFTVSGCAFTRWPADPNATLEQMAASAIPKGRVLMVNAGWKNDRDHQQAVAHALAPVAQATSASAWKGSEAPDKFFAYVPKEAEGPDGKKSLRKFPLASSEKKGLDPAILRDALARFSQADIPAADKGRVHAKIMAAISHWNAKHADQKIEVSDKSGSDPIIGYTDASMPGPHKHPITKNLMILPAVSAKIPPMPGQETSDDDYFSDHSHYMGMMSLENEADGLHLCGVTSCRMDYIPNDNGMDNGQGEYSEHCHTFDLGGTGHSELSGVVEVKEVESMDIKERIATLRKSAQAVATSNPAESKNLSDLANAMEKEVAVNDVEQVIAARVKSGDLFSKSAHEAALTAARAEGEAALRKQIEDAKKADELKAQTIATRMGEIKKAKLEPKFVLRKDWTIEQEVATIPVGADGDKRFTERLEEWMTISKATGQMVAKEGAAASETGTTRPPIASSNSSAAGDNPKKSAMSYA